MRGQGDLLSARAASVAAPTASDVLVFQWPNAFDPTAGAGVAVPPGKAAFGWDAETSPGAGDGTLWIYAGPTAKKWSPVAFVYNLAQAWGTINSIIGAWNYGSGMPRINYFSPATNPDSAVIDIAIADLSSSFRVHIRTVIGGTGFDPPPSGGGVILHLRINGVNLATDATQPGVIVYVDTGRAGSAFEDNPGSLDLGNPPTIYDCTRPGDVFDVTLESLFPYALASTQMLRISSRQLTPSRSNRTSLREGFVPVIGAGIASVGLGLVASGSPLPLPVFDHTQTVAAKVESSY